MINAQIGPREDYSNALIVINSPEVDAQPFTAILDISGWRSFEPSPFALDMTALDGAISSPEAYGRLLGKSLFASDGLGRLYSETLAVVQGRGDGLRVRLLVNAPDLHKVHWERLFQPIDGEWLPLGATAGTPFSRFVSPQQWARPQPVTKRPVRLLLVIASPSDIDRASLDPIPQAERDALHELFGHIPEITFDVLESGTNFRPTVDALRAKLAEGFEFVHFVCHGVETQAGTALFLEKEDGSIDIVKTERLVSAFKAVQTPPVFVFFTACESASRSRFDGFLPVGPALVEDGGVQVSLAMTGRVGFSLAQQFTRQFYQRLFKHGVVDLAVNEARALVQDHWDWGAPVLFSRLPDNQLLDFPIGRIYDDYLSHTDRAFAAVDEAIQAARLEEHGHELVANLQELVNELRKSHGALVEIASSFRRTGHDPETFAAQFESFYYEFKAYYDQQTWVEEQISCNKIIDLRARILPRLAPILNDRAMDSLRQELDVLSDFDQNLVKHFQEYLDEMDAAVESIWTMLSDKKVDDAIQSKLDFEAQISPSFQRSKKMFERMGTSIRGVQAA